MNQMRKKSQKRHEKSRKIEFSIFEPSSQWTLLENQLNSEKRANVDVVLALQLVLNIEKFFLNFGSLS